MNANDNRRARRLGLAVGAAAGVAISLAAASPAVAGTHTSASVVNGTLTVTGSNGKDQLALRLAPGNFLQVDFGDDGSAEFSFNRDTFTKIDVFLRNGADAFRVDPATAALTGPGLTTVNGGNGKDTLNGGAGAEHFIGGSGKDFVDGNGGNDTADLGSGNDTFIWDPGDGSDTIDGGGGIDTLDFRGANVAEIMALSPNESESDSIFTRNLGNIRMTMDRVERLDLTAEGGADTVTIDDMSGTDFRQADVDLGGADGAADTVTVNGTPNADHIKVTAQGTQVNVRGLPTETSLTGTETNDTLDIETGAGNDTFDIHPHVFALIGVSVDGDPQP